MTLHVITMVYDDETKKVKEMHATSDRVTALGMLALAAEVINQHAKQQASALTAGLPNGAQLPPPPGRG